MRFLTPLIYASTVAAWYKGINFGAQLPNGACRSQADWLRGFQTVKNLPPHFDTARVFASSDCNTLQNAVPAALQAGVKLLVTVWTQDEAHFNREKGALLQAISAHPNYKDWMVAVSVGSEDLYRKETTPSKIAQKIYDVRGMLRAKGVNTWVGHVDTWTAWVDSANKEVIKACDWVGTDGYPYWQGTAISQSATVFWQSVNNVRNVVKNTKNVPVWLTETGWPVSGKNVGASVANVQNARAYWKAVACPGFAQADLFWYAYSEPSASPAFSMVDANDKPMYDMSC